MAVSPLAILTPVGNFRSGAAFASQIALTSVEAIHLHEGCHILGRNVFLPEKVPHVSRQHLKLDVRPGEIEITVVGQNPAAVTNLGYPTLRLNPGESALLKEGCTLDFLPGSLRFQVTFTRTEGPSQKRNEAEKLTKPVEGVTSEVPAACPGPVVELESGEGCASLGSGLMLHKDLRTPPVVAGPTEFTVTQMHPDSAPLRGDPGSGVQIAIENGKEGEVMHRLESRALKTGESAQPDAGPELFCPGGQSVHSLDHLAQDEALARRLQAEEEYPPGAHSYQSRELIESDEALARALQEHEELGKGEKEQGGAPPERKRQRRSEDTGGVQPSTSVGVHEESGAQGSEGPGSFQLLQVHALPAWANRGCQISDIVRGDLQWCILTNYMIDLEWLLSACPILYHVPRVVLVHGEAGEALARLQTTKPANFSLHKPPLPISYGTHHSKAMLLVYPRGVRVVVHTANLIYIDWNNKTQGLWYQDFPVKTPDSPPSSPFESDLLDYLEALKWPGALVPSPDSAGEGTRVTASFFRRFDYSRAAVRLVASVPGYHSGRWLTKWGHMKMRAVLEKEAFADDFRRAPLVYQFSSLGSLDERWMSEFLASLSQGRTTSGQALGPGEVRIVWPTVEDVRQSIEGYCAGGAIPGPEKNVTRPWLQQYWSKFEADHSGRSRVMPHIKTFVRYRGQDVAWFLLTSSNLSKAAWGSLQRNDTQLMVRSYELGVLFLPSLVAKYGLGDQFSCTESRAGEAALASRNGILVNARDRNAESGAESVGMREGEAGRVGNDSGAGLPHESSTGVEETFPSRGKRKHSEEREESRSVRFVTTAKRLDLHDSEPTGSEAPGDASATVRLPIPYALPPAKYGSKDRPWAVDRQYVKPDVYGETWPRTVVKYGLKQSDEGG